MKDLTNRIKNGARNLVLYGATALGLVFGAGKAGAQEQLRIFSPKHVTAINPQGIVTGGYTSQTANYEEEIGRLKSTNGSWYGDQVVNPFIRPGYRDKDMGEREYYGSKDVNGNHIINESADVQAIYNGSTSYRGDVNGDGVTNSTDAGIIQSVMEGKIPYAPSDWNYLTKEEKIDYFDKLKALDDTDYYREGWTCGEYMDRFFLKFAGLEKAAGYDNGSNFDQLINMYDENGLYNLPVYSVSVKAGNGVNHFINAILVGDDPTNFDDWYFIEPQTDARVFPGDFSMRSEEGDIAGIWRLCYYYSDLGQSYRYDAQIPVVFDLHNNFPPTLAWKNKDLVTSRPTNPVSGIENIVSPYENSSISAFPNPVSNGYDLDIVNNTGQFTDKGQLGIFDISGKLVYEEKSLKGVDNKIIIPSDKIQAFEDGVYFVVYTGLQQRSAVKIVKQAP